MRRPRTRFWKLEAEDLQNDETMRAYYAQITTLPKPWISRSQFDWVNFWTAIEHALDQDTQGRPGALFVWILQNRRWDVLTDAEEKHALERLKKIPARKAKPDPTWDLQRKAMNRIAEYQRKKHEPESKKVLHPGSTGNVHPAAGDGRTK